MREVIIMAALVAVLTAGVIAASDNSAAYEQCEKKHSRQVCINILR